MGEIRHLDSSETEISNSLMVDSFCTVLKSYFVHKLLRGGFLNSLNIKDFTILVHASLITFCKYVPGKVSTYLQAMP